MSYRYSSTPMSSDDLDYSSSGFSSDNEDVRKDAELERRNLHKDLAIGGLEVYDEKEDDDEINYVQHEQDLRVNEQLRLRYGSAREVTEQQKQNINLAAQRITQGIEQNIKDMMEKQQNNNVNTQQSQIETKMDRRMRQMQNIQNYKLQKQNKELQRKYNELQRKEMIRQKQEEDQQKEAEEINNHIQDNQQIDFSPIQHDQEVGNPDQQPEQKQIQYQKVQFKGANSPNQPFEQQTDFFQNIDIKRDNEQKQINFKFQVSYDTTTEGFSQTDLKPFQLAVWDQFIYMFLLNAQKYERNKALLWGKVPVLTQEEIQQQKQNQNIQLCKHLQTACIVVDELPYQYYLQLSDEIHEQLFNLPEGLNKPGSEPLWNELFSQFGQPVLKDDLLLFDENQNIPDKFIKNQVNLQTYLKQVERFIIQKTNGKPLDIKIKPVLRAYCFNNPETPRHPRFWLRVRYNSILPKLPEFTKVTQLFDQNVANSTHDIELEYNKIGIVQMFGGSVDPLELFLCENQIKCCSWMRFKGVQVTAYKNRWDIIANDLKNVSKEELNYYPYEHYNKLLSKSVTRVFHEFYMPYNKKHFESLQFNEQLMGATFSAVTFTFIWAYSESQKQQFPLLSILTFMPKVGLQSHGEQKDKNTITYIIGCRFDNQLPFQKKTINVQLSTVSFDSTLLSESARVHLIPATSEVDLIDKTHQIISQLNPDFIVGHGIYDAYAFMFQQVAKIPDQIVKEMLFKCSRLNQVNNIRVGASGRDVEAKVSQIFSGRIIIDIERSIQEFSPDTKLTSLEYCFNTLFPDLSFQALPLSAIVDSYKNNNNDFEKILLPNLLQQQFANLKVQRGLNLLQLYSGISRITFSPLQSVISHGRAKRVETLLLSRFVQLPFVIPDYPNALEEQSEKYEGGYVIEPKPGLYDTLIIVLDFNSLYPSVIREFDICFTTVPPEVSTNNALEYIDKAKEFVFSRQLPQLMGNLVQKRQSVKKLIKNVQVKLRTRPKEIALINELQELDIEQLALKLCANSMYGCLGYRLGRFFCPKVAATITYQGRQALANAMSVAEQNGYKVVYGDTDSIMIDSKLSLSQIDEKMFNTPGSEQNEAKAKIRNILVQCEQISQSLTKQIGEGRRYLEMAMDYVFARQLLLQKKKYAALKIDPISYSLKLEIRGLDMVRRDWCLLSRQICHKVVSCLLWCGKSLGVERTLEYLSGFKNDMDERNRNITFEFFMLTKSITKLLSQYEKSGNQPHVDVARWLEQRQHKIIKPGFVVKYLALSAAGIQLLQTLNQNDGLDALIRHNGPSFLPYDTVVTKAKGYHPLQIIDLEWYIKSQIVPPLERLYNPIETVGMNDVAGLFGLEITGSGSAGSGGDRTEIFSTDLRRRYADCLCFVYRCPVCSTLYSWPEAPILHPGFAPQVSFTRPSRRHRNRSADIEGKAFLHPDDFEKLQCGHAVQAEDVVEQILQQIKHFEHIYQSGMRSCTKSDCTCHLTNEEVKKLISKLPYAIEHSGNQQSNYTNLQSPQIQEKQQELNDNHPQTSMSEAKVEGPLYIKPVKQGLICPGNMCIEQKCNNELYPILERQTLILQFLFFQEIFDRTSQFFKEIGVKTQNNTSELFDIISSFLTDYAKISGLGTVKVSSALKNIFQNNI